MVKFTYLDFIKAIQNNDTIKLIGDIDVDLLNDDELKMFKNTVSFDGSTPITIFFKNGEEKTTATRIEGDVSEEKLINKLKTNGFIE